MLRSAEMVFQKFFTTVMADFSVQAVYSRAVTLEGIHLTYTRMLMRRPAGRTVTAERFPLGRVFKLGADGQTAFIITDDEHERMLLAIWITRRREGDMRITDVQTTMLRLPDVRPIADGTQDTLIVQVHTDAGVVGVGEAHTSPWIAKAVIEAPVSHYMARGLREILIGNDPLEIDQRWDDMYRYTQVFGRRGITVHAMSAIDIALWDILGKVLDRPIHALLGGARRHELRPYASILALETPDASVERARALVDSGFQAIKFGWSGLGGHVQRDLDTVAAIRDAVGADVDLMLDIGAPMPRDAALRLARGLEALNVYFLEEPLAPDDIEGYADLASSVTLPIAAGEKETTRWGFKPLIDARALDIVQPDIARVGGISEVRRIADHAELNGVRVIPHCWSTDILVAATCHFLATRSTDTYLEYCLIDTPIRNDVAQEPIRVVDGVVHVPDGPGLGVELNMSTLQQYAYPASMHH